MCVCVCVCIVGTTVTVLIAGKEFFYLQDAIEIFSFTGCLCRHRGLSEVFPPEINLPRREADHLRSSNAKVQNARN